MEPPCPPDPELASLHARLWAELDAAAHDKAHAWRTPVLATAGGSAGVDARVVVLRETDCTGESLVFFTDARSRKVAQVAGQPTGVLVLWSPALSWQLRLTVRLEVETSGLAVSSRWARLQMTPAAQDYLAPRAPGQALTAPPERETRSHFAVITARVLVMDWLALAPPHHRRALFDATGPRWVQP
jgi:pyridoxamine 5'-phosphate oxidase